MALFNLARMTVASSGTGTITLNTAVSGFLTFDLAGASTAAAGQVVTYAINDTTQSEIGTGTYISSALTLTRGSSTSGLKSTNGNSPINMSNAAQVFITPNSADIGTPPIVRYYNTTSTWTKPQGLSAILVEIRGGGGAGGGVDNSAGLHAGGGGGQGGYSLKRYAAVTVGTTGGEAITVGTGGVGVGGSNGNPGTTTSFSTNATYTISATGGGGGIFNSSDDGTQGGVGGTGSGGDINWKGQSGASGVVDSAGSLTFGGGLGGGEGGGRGAAGGNGAGEAGTNGGGGGGAGSNGLTANPGGNGGDGWVKITEYYGASS